ncbi:MAG: DUF488 domain-containing protein [Acidimicrobiia bacterium]
MRSVLFTVGHGATPFYDLLRRLQSHGVRMVLDVRSQPYSSRAPHYNKSELEAELIAAGISYRWLGDRLGGKPLQPGGQVPIEDEARLAAGVTDAAGLARGATSALLCAELDPSHCHRTTPLATAFEDEGFTVVHILEDGTARTHQPTLGL